MGSEALMRLHHLLVDPLVGIVQSVVSNEDAKGLLRAVQFVFTSHDIPPHATETSLKDLLVQKT